MKPIKLDDIEKKQQPFSVPDGYFDDLAMRIQSRVDAEKKPIWYQKPTFRMSLAFASVVVIVMSIVLFDPALTPEELLAEIPEDELLAYVNTIQFDENEILEVFEGSFETIEFFDSEGIETMDLEDESLDDLLLEYDLTEDLL